MIPIEQHNHRTGRVRGLLCASCNTALGMGKESETILTNMIQYLREVCNDTK